VITGVRRVGEKFFVRRGTGYPRRGRGGSNRDIDRGIVDCFLCGRRRRSRFGYWRRR
jgi:hypothetical protein